ncbi:hypothetical protein [Arthrobacter pityocampae]|nr:hypothetical protein [Arthrobacter pityocampae]
MNTEEQSLKFAAPDNSTSTMSPKELHAELEPYDPYDHEALANEPND